MYLIIGASGFLGRYVIKNVLENTCDYIIATFSSKEPLFQNKRVRWRKLNVCDIDEICSLNSEIEEDVKIIYLSAYHHFYVTKFKVVV